MGNFYKNWAIGDLRAEYDRKYRERRGGDDVKSAESFCGHFCPLEEECRRRMEGDYDKEYEKEFLVKRYERSVAGRQFEEYESIRNTGALEETLEYLVNLPLDYKSYKFIDNRIRAIKADLESLSGIVGDSVCPDKIHMLETISRFYVVSLYVLYTVENDLYQVMEQLRKTLNVLMHEYNSCNQYSNEFVEYYILSNMEKSETVERTISRYAPSKLNCINEALVLFNSFVSQDYGAIFGYKRCFLFYCITLYYHNMLRISVVRLLKKGI
ncbi:SAC32 [Enterospora canceri]|uniref:SAC32 n=1 Tax=Enterospora canceri TaxID=1081671 RepID=A0A1Y1S988_9MICR|nr:SAC32 [Enterospora canceri]